MKTRKMSRPNRIISTAMALVLALYTCVVPVSMAGAADASESTNSNYELAKTATNLDDKFESDIQLKVTPKGGSEGEAEAPEADVVFVVDCSSILRENAKGLFASLDTMVKALRSSQEDAAIKIGMVGFNNSTVDVFGLTDLSSVTDDFLETQKQRFANAKAYYKSFQDRKKFPKPADGTWGDLAPWVAFGAAAREFHPNEKDDSEANMAFYEKYPENSPYNDKLFGRVPTGEGTNLQAGLIAGETMLKKGSAKNSNKHIVVISDGATFYYNKTNSDGSVTTSVSTVSYGWGQPRIVGNMDCATSSAKANYDAPAFSAYVPNGSKSGDGFKKFIAEKGSSIATSVASENLFTKEQFLSMIDAAGALKNESWSETLAYADTAYNLSDEASSSQGARGSVTDRANYPYTNMERGTYFAAKEMQRLKQEGYSLVVAAFEYVNSDAPLRTLSGSFMEWTQNVGQYYYLNNDLGSTNAEDAANLGDFSIVTETVKDKLATTTTLKAGSYITDEMGYGSDDGHGNAYDFDFVDNVDSLSVVVKGTDGTSTTYNAVKVEDGLSEDETSRYEFKADGSEDAAFVMHYYANEATSNPKADSFRLDINRDIEAGEELTVNYKVHLTNPQTEAGTYGTYDRDGSNNTGGADVPLETNHVAKLQPKDGDEEKFPEPTVSYTVEPSTLTLTGKKVWDDAGNQDGVRPSTVAIAVYGSDNSVRTVAVTGSGNEWSFSVPDLPKKTAAGEDIAYTVDEPSVPAGYTKSVSGTTITNAHTPATTSVSGTKTWDDGDNQDGVRPSSITVRLLANGMNLQSKTVTAADNWRYSFTDLPKYAGGHEVAYTVTEDAVTDYTATVSGFNITNKHAPGKTSVSVTKAWNDSSNADGSRPSSVSVQLYADGAAKGSAVTLSAENSWAYTWSDLPEKAKGTAIAYTVAETGVAKGYTSSVTGDAKTGFTITNAHTPELVSVEGTKTWVDDDDQDGKRPSSIVVRLKNGSKLVATQTVSPDASGAWKYKFEDLPKYDEGTEISYSIEEDTVAGYKASYKGYNITNTYSPEQTRVAGTKVWKDGNDADGVRPKSVTVNLYANGEKIASGEVSGKGNVWAYRFTDLPKYAGGKKISYTVDEDAVEGYTSKVDGFKIVNTHKPVKVDISGAKVWNDANDQDGVRPSKVTVNLLADGEVVQSETVAGAGSTWHFSFTGLPRTKAGKEISYSVSEDAVRGYTASYSGNAEDGFTITNAHTPEQVSVSGAKTWDDDADRDGERPDAITVRLHANGAEVASKTVSAADNWRYSFSGLPKYSGGAQVVYTVTEDAVVGYSSTTRGANITNAHTPGLTSVTVSKVWDDDADRDSLRPASVSVQLNANGRKQGAPVTLNEDNGWTYTWHALYANEAGVPINYTVEETDVPEGYTATVTGDAVRGYVISNEHEAATVEIPVTKVWDDDGDDVGLRPDSVTMRLYVNGLETDETLELTAQGDWSGAFEGLAKVVDGEEAVYTVEEEAVDGYEASVAGSAEEGYTVTNSLEIFDFDDHDTPLAPGSSFEGDDEDSGSKASTDSDSDDGTDIDDDGTPTAGADGDDGDSSTGGDGGGNVHTGDDSPVGPLSALLLLALAGGSGALVARRLPGAKR